MHLLENTGIYLWFFIVQAWGTNNILVLFFFNQTQRGRKKIHNEIFNNIAHYMILNVFVSNFFKMIIVLYNYKIIICKKRIYSFYIWDYDPIGLQWRNRHIFYFTTEDMKYKFETFSKNKINAIDLTEIMQTDWLQTFISQCSLFLLDS